MAETVRRWRVLGHPAWGGGIDFATPAEAEKHFWTHPKLDGTHEGMTIVRIDKIRYEPYVPSRPESEGKA